MTRLFCACCGRPFQRQSTRGPAPLYCSTDCRIQMAVRRRAWTRADLVVTPQPQPIPHGANQNRTRPRYAA
ncbi:hypothetical protein [Azospirillum sp. sgz301742]